MDDPVLNIAADHQNFHLMLLTGHTLLIHLTFQAVTGQIPFKKNSTCTIQNMLKTFG